mgnify:CR=1 FL=1
MSCIGEIKRASEATIKVLVAIGALYVDDTGIHASEPGIYPKEKSTHDR